MERLEQSPTADLNATPPAEVEAGLGDVLRDYLEVARRLQATHESLQGEVVRLRQELASKDQELERRRRLAALGELAAGVAHEVRNPLGAIQLYSELLRNECRRIGPALSLIEKIENGIQAIDRVVHDTLALAPSRERQRLCPLRDIVENAADVCQPRLQSAGAALRVTYADPDVCVTADPDGLQRVFVNLISNAAEVSPSGGAVVLDVCGAADGGVEVHVSDEGPGLPEDLLYRIFDPFFTTKEHGTGLGLTIAHRLVEAHGGTLSAHNRAAGGAEFVVALPPGDGAPQGRERSDEEMTTPDKHEECRHTSAA